MKPLPLFAFCLLSITTAFSQQQATDNTPDADTMLYQKREFIFSQNQTLPYRILYPKNYDKTKKYPLVLFLHGKGERGTDNTKQLVHGSRLFLKKENRENFPAIVIFPQCPEDSYWAAGKIDDKKHPLGFELNYSLEPNWPLKAANELVKKIIAEEAVDQSSVYISGLSMGGMGTFESVYRYPKLYAAALPICGVADVDKYNKRVKKTAFWIFHGQADDVVSVTYSQKIAARLKSLKIESQYTEYPNVKHNSWDNAFAEPTYLSWMFSHKRK